ncbi:MAG: FtsQ-type POTRA domain-containing protein [archaeon]|jgi:hypothetical protein|nr:FtsQ-type POTRA domain-containing protein [archaeon]
MAARYRKPYRIQRKKYWWKSRALWVSFAIILAILGFAYGLFFSYFLQLEHIRIEGNDRIEADEIEQAADAASRKDVLFLEFRHMLLFSSRDIEAALVEQFPQIEEVRVQKRFFHELAVTIKERRQSAVWCAKEECFALDLNGVVFEEKSAEGNIVFSQEGQETAPALGESVVDKALLARLFQFIKQVQGLSVLRDAQAKVISITFISPQRISAQISERWDVYITPEEDFEWQGTKLDLVLEEKAPSTEERESIEYIDLRFGDKAFLKH